MKLLFLIQKNAWFVAHARAWYRVEGKEQVEYAISVLPLVIVDQSKVIEQPHQAGTVEIKARRADEMAFDFRSHDGEAIDSQTVLSNELLMSHVSWTVEPWEDGWVGSRSSLQIENVAQVELVAWLPEKSGSKTKSLKVRRSDNDSELQITMQRGKKSKIRLLDAPAERRVKLELSCDQEGLESSQDLRKLGFVLLEQNVKAA